MTADDKPGVASAPGSDEPSTNWGPRALRHSLPSGVDPQAITGDCWSMVVSRDEQGRRRIVATFHDPRHGREFWNWMPRPLRSGEQWELWERSPADLLWRQPDVHRS